MKSSQKTKIVCEFQAMAEASGSIISSECIFHYIDSVQTSLIGTVPPLTPTEIKNFHLKFKDEAIAKVVFFKFHY